MTVAGILISVATAYSAQAFPNIFDVSGTALRHFVGAPFGTFLLGAFTRGGRGTAAFYGYAEPALPPALAITTPTVGEHSTMAAISRWISGAPPTVWLDIGTALGIHG